ncbi:ATP synthase subunit I [Hydrogenoanaerobacterium saccharovorans]|jgi:ATP synthase I chain|uniref:ATP synthase subunit I n=1 Tax=Hydrogenoanaerobacterium saccharovorans TaxID=474960 RepID=A0ABS2GIQ7_9FIRM|nr:ATP synthase subunit I [Hydrogenoanaerobacterium saccharovorans]MBM6922362.1 ATP synthase subunit I [Hydrogenoanaerobacterium saccharovorans]HIY82221.1 ATP synthase subunit I [Bacillota bacterium]
MEIALEELRRLRWELLVCNLLLLGGLLLLGRDLVPVLLGMALGNSAAAANFVLTGIAAEEAVQLPPDQARRKMASSYFSRMLMLALVLAAGLVISWFDPISVVFPLFFVKISLTVGYIFLGKGGNKN